ncbi:MAG TPA: glycosyltransferase [Thermodesulfobacteriota bacterium]|nr:glycosyltransferase [Thermodesulfobacteriota bacterium]
MGNFSRIDSKTTYEKSALLSIIVLTYNRKDLLLDCLDSLFSQTIRSEDLEIIVVDDGSTDGTDAIVKDISQKHPGLRYCRQAHKGIPAARNRGIAASSGDIVAIVADDYLLAPDYAETIIRFFREKPAAMVVRFKIVAADYDFASRVCHFYYDVSVRRRLNVEETTEESRLASLKKRWQRLPVTEERITTRHELEAAGGAAFRKEVFRIVGFFDESLMRGEDTDMTRRLREKGVPVYYYPYHQIKHRYSQGILSTAYKCFMSGRHGWNYYNKYSNSSVGLSHLAILGIKGKLSVMLDAFWRARQTSTAGEFILYLPFMFLFEISNKLGFLWGALHTKWTNLTESRTKPRLDSR